MCPDMPILQKSKLLQMNCGVRIYVYQYVFSSTFAGYYGFVQLFIMPKKRRRLIKQIDFDSLSKAIYACPSVCAYLDIVPTYKI